jgi:hypothetical protein
MELSKEIGLSYSSTSFFILLITIPLVNPFFNFLYKFFEAVRILDPQRVLC